MSGNNATFQVDGPAAHQIAKNILSNLGMDAEAIEQVNMDLVFGDENTSIEIDADGPLSGIIVAQMVSGVEWSDHTATAIDATFAEAQNPSGASAEETAEDADGGPQPDAGGSKPQVIPLSESADTEAAEFPTEAPGRITENTHPHVAACLLVEWYETMDDKWASGRKISEFAGDDLAYDQTQPVMSRLFVERGLTIRRKERGAGTLRYEYQPTKQLAEEVERLGEYDIELVRESTERHGG